MKQKRINNYQIQPYQSKHGFVKFELLQEKYLEENGIKQEKHDFGATICRLRDTLQSIYSAQMFSPYYCRDKEIYTNFLEAKELFSVLPEEEKRSYNSAMRFALQASLEYLSSQIRDVRKRKANSPENEETAPNEILAKAKEMRSFLASITAKNAPEIYIKEVSWMIPDWD